MIGVTYLYCKIWHCYCSFKNINILYKNNFRGLGNNSLIIRFQWSCVTCMYCKKWLSNGYFCGGKRFFLLHPLLRSYHKNTPNFVFILIIVKRWQVPKILKYTLKAKKSPHTTRISNLKKYLFSFSKQIRC